MVKLRKYIYEVLYHVLCCESKEKYMMTLVKIYHRHYLSSIIVKVIQLLHVYHIRVLLICNFHSNSIGEWRLSMWNLAR